MKEYKAYKATKIEFLNKIPRHWKEFRLRYLGYLYGGLTGKNSSDFNQERNPSNKRFIPFINISENQEIDIKNLQDVIIK